MGFYAEERDAGMIMSFARDIVNNWCGGDMRKAALRIKAAPFTEELNKIFHADPGENW